MDGLSHVLVGLCVAAWSRDGLTPSHGLACAAAALATDAFFVPLALTLGRDARRTLWIPRDADWRGARERYPKLTALGWDLPYSLVGAGVVCSALWSWAGAAIAVAYASHVVIDYPTHHGEWSVKPFYPFSQRAFAGMNSAWEWPVRKMAFAWAALALVLGLSLYARLRLGLGGIA